jgi:hypothetical protein
MTTAAASRASSFKCVSENVIAEPGFAEGGEYAMAPARLCSRETRMNLSMTA